MRTTGIGDSVEDPLGSINSNFRLNVDDVEETSSNNVHESLLDQEDRKNERGGDREKASVNQGRDRKDNVYLVSYLYGQLASVCMMGMWWVLLSPITIAFFGNKGVGISRLVYNVALFFFSLVAGAMTDKVRLFDLLIQTTIGRVMIYSLMLPMGAFLLQSNTFFEFTEDQKDLCNAIFGIFFMILIFADGIIVAASNNIAVDLGGTHLCATQYGIEVDEGFENLQGRYDSIYSATFDGSMVLLAPLVAFAGYLFHKYSSFSETTPEEDEEHVIKDALLMTSCLGVAFLLLGLLSIIFYCRLPRNPPNHVNALKDEKIKTSESIFTQIWVALGKFPYIVSSIWNNKIIFWRIIFFGLETGLEDAMIAVIVPLYCNQIACNVMDIVSSSSSEQYLQECKHDFSLKGNIYIAVVVALGKIGAVLAGFFMHSKFASDSEQKEQVGEYKKYGWLFWWSLFGGVSSLLVPVSLMIVEDYFNSSDSTSNEYYAVLLLSPCIFIFNFLTTVPKIGFQNLLQVYVSKEEDASQIWGLLAAFTTLADAAVVTIISFISPPYLDLTTALWFSCSLYALVGLFEGIWGPRLVLGPVDKRGNDFSASQHSYQKISTD